ncbi:MAG: hypothetical protein WD711_11990 [Dongiaceae bacterium]
MSKFRDFRATDNRVVAVFGDGMESFELPQATTLAQLAARLVRLSELHGDPLLRIDVRLGNLPQERTHRSLHAAPSR